MSIWKYWICEIALLASGFIYVHTLQPRHDMKKRLTVGLILFFIFTAIVNQIQYHDVLTIELIMRTIGFLFLVRLMWIRRAMKWHFAVYYAIWAFMSWQLLYEICLFLSVFLSNDIVYREPIGLLIDISVFTIGLSIVAFTIGKWIPDGGQKKIGPRQFSSAVLLFLLFQLLVFVPGTIQPSFTDWRWAVMYMGQLLIAVILYLQNELFKKSDMRQELMMMNLLWKKEQEQYELSRETIALIDQKCHDLKHQIRAIRQMDSEGKDEYLKEIEDSIHIYEAIVKTGNEVLDTILTEKSLGCKEKGIRISCVADGAQMDFIQTIDLYAILGNAIDNAIEAVEKFEEVEKRQVDVMIYRQQQFLAVNVINPVKERLVYQDSLPVTTKQDKGYHGFGLRNMKYLLKKYDGVLSISEADGCFSLMMLIPVPKSI